MVPIYVDPVILGKSIRKLRELRNFTQSYMAQQLHMTQGNYAKLEKGGITFTEDRLNQIARVLNFPQQEILELNTEALFDRKLTRPDVRNLSDSASFGRPPVDGGLSYFTISPELKVLYESRIRQLEEYVQELKLRLGDRDGSNEDKVPQ